MMSTCVLHLLRGSQQRSLRPALVPRNFVVAMLKTIRGDSSGGVGAKMASCPAVHISRAANPLRMLGFSSSPLFVSTHQTEMGARPILPRPSLIVLSSQTPFVLKYSMSFLRATPQKKRRAAARRGR